MNPGSLAAPSGSALADRDRGAVGRHETALHLAIVLAVALAARVAVLPFASQDTLDHTIRIWIAWRWAEDPFLLFHGMWPPLHFFLLGPVVRLFADPIFAPVLFHLAVGTAIPVVVYLFAAREFGDLKAALAVGIAYALYPVAIRNSLEALAQAPFVLFAALALLALSRAREPSADWRHAAVAGVALTLASMIRYEGWMLIPFLAPALWPRVRLIAVFVAVASVWPALSMVAGFLHYGDPFAGINASASYELGAMGKDQMSLVGRADQVLSFVLNVVVGMTPLLALLAGLGALSCLLRRAPQAVWLIPTVGLCALLFAAAARGSINPKSHYTETFGLLLIPYLAAFLLSPQVRRLRDATGTAPVHAVLFGSMAALLVVGTLRDLPGVRERSGLVDAIPALGPAPTFAGKDELDNILPAIREEGGGLVADFLGYGATGYLTLHSRRHPDQVHIVSVAPESPPGGQRPERLRSRGAFPQPLVGSDPPHLAEFVLDHRTGILVLQPDSRFSAWVDFEEGTDRASVRGIDLVLTELARIPWPLPADERLRAEGVPATARGEVVVFRYSVVGGDARGG